MIYFQTCCIFCLVLNSLTFFVVYVELAFQMSEYLNVVFSIKFTWNVFFKVVNWSYCLIYCMFENFATL